MQMIQRVNSNRHTIYHRRKYITIHFPALCSIVVAARVCRNENEMNDDSKKNVSGKPCVFILNCMCVVDRHLAGLRGTYGELRTGRPYVTRTTNYTKRVAF